MAVADSLALSSDRLAFVDADDDALWACTQRVSVAAGAERAITQLQIGGIHCAACASIIEQALRSQPGVLDAQVNSSTQRLALTWSPGAARLADVLSVLAPLGYRAVPDVAVQARLLRRAEHRQALWRLFVAAFLMMQVMMLATPIYVAEPGDLAPDVERLLIWAQWVLSLPVLVFASGPFLSAAWQQVRSVRVGMEVPVALGLLITFLASSVSTFDPTGPLGSEVYFDSFTMFVTFLLAGRYVQVLARHRVAGLLERSVADLPQRAFKRDDERSQWAWVDATRLREGDVIQVANGEAFAADGVVLEGQTCVDERLMSGESDPVLKAPGTEVLAGSLNLEAPVVVRVLRAGADTRLGSIESLMRQALTHKPASQAIADAIARPFLAAVLTLAVVAGIAWWWLEPHRALWVAVAVLIVTCPCALSLAAPSAWLSAAGALARRGVLLARLDALEALATADTLVLDKTGTLTTELMAFDGSWPPAPGAPMQERAASLAALSRHPYARALVGALGAPAQAVAWSDVQEFPGRGLQARDAQGRTWRLGSPIWACEGSTDDDLATELIARGCQVVMACRDGVVGPAGPVGCGRDVDAVGFRWIENLRPQAHQTLTALRDSGVDVRVLSGDATHRVRALAEQAGLDPDRALGGQSPEQKRLAVAALQAQGRKVWMVGDGINDAPVLAQADVSFVMGHAAMTARSSADGVILSNGLQALLELRGMAAAVVKVVKRNLMWAAAYNATCIPLAMVGWLPPWAAGLGMALSSAGVVLHSATLLRRQAFTP
jgi:Cu2+-exporting ATPase